MILKNSKLYQSLICFIIAGINCQEDKLGSSTRAIVINTWNFTDANLAAWKVLSHGGSALDAIEIGCGQCEIDQCDGTVGWGGSPSETGETTLDAMIMDGQNYNVGAVGGLRRIKSAIAVARKVLDHTNHSLLVGDMATQFAIQLGFKEENLTSDKSLKMWSDWKAASCQPNYWTNVSPNPRMSCGPYHVGSITSQPESISLKVHESSEQTNKLDPGHDTIGMVAIDADGRMAAGTSTNGLRYKILGRVGDSPIAGAGAYAAHDAGAAAATGDGDVMMRYLISYQAVENMRRGMRPSLAVDDALRRMAEGTGQPWARAAAIALDRYGNFGAACIGIKKFPFVVSNSSQNIRTHVIECKAKISDFRTRSSYVRQ
ncbi:putative N(4)-(beta-N-acetylglucosaminyl)-L-asparaginase [Fragariocoptes setiger]|uniref:N(4)-(Beta-N-acetylglucosaminyl)-L-asparaginase n=1 Tax=Fragariocoptes setiger TaxID=1670756 RepID=A0ABQ7S516_9ACAR|nr:putative N(4)-(beta-N-acetylglucosaminyl)-L-asparaginase [Fragariocoptes setiger]